LTGKDASEFTINQLNLAEYATAPNNLPMAVRGVVHTSSDFIGAAVDGAGYTNNDVDGDDADVVDPFTYTAFVDPSGNSVTRQQLEAAMNARLSAARQGAPPPVVLSVPAGSKYLNGPEYFPLVKVFLLTNMKFVTLTTCACIVTATTTHLRVCFRSGQQAWSLYGITQRLRGLSVLT
jgi:hypothetical protein